MHQRLSASGEGRSDQQRRRHEKAGGVEAVARVSVPTWLNRPATGASAVVQPGSGTRVGEDCCVAAGTRPRGWCSVKQQVTTVAGAVWSARAWTQFVASCAMASVTCGHSPASEASSIADTSDRMCRCLNRDMVRSPGGEDLVLAVLSSYTHTLSGHGPGPQSFPACCVPPHTSMICPK